MAKQLLFAVLVLVLSGCSSTFVVKSDPLQADVYIQDLKTGEKKVLGKTPLEMPTSEVKKTVGEGTMSGEFFRVVVEKQGYLPESFNIPATRFGTLVTALDVKMKQGTAAKEERVARVLLDHLFLAQKLALAKQFDRAQLELDKLLADFPEFPRALSMRASIYYVQKNYVESLKWYEEALKQDPQMEDAVQMVAKIHTLQGGGRVPANTAPSKKKGDKS